MARISLLFSLAFALGLGSLFLSVSSHVLPPSPGVVISPKTVYELQTLPFTKITQFLDRKEKYAPKTVEFKAMFTTCKSFVAYLESLYKLENPIVDVLGIAKAKYLLLNKAIIVAKNSIIVKVDKKTSKRLKTVCGRLAIEFLKIQETIMQISATHDFKASAKLSKQETFKISSDVIAFKNHLDAFMDIVEKVEEKKLKKVGPHVRKLGEEKKKDLFERIFGNFVDKIKERKTDTVGPHVRIVGEEKEKSLFEQYFGDLVDKIEEKKPKKVGPHVRVLGEERRQTIFERFFGNIVNKYGGYMGGKAHGRELTEAQFNAAGKMKFVGKDGFRSLKREHYKIMV